MHRFKRAEEEEEGQLFTSARYNFEENDVNCKCSLVAARRLVAQEHLFRNIFFLSFCIFGLHIIGCGSEAKYNLTVTTCQKCLKTGHSTSSLYKMKTFFSWPTHVITSGSELNIHLQRKTSVIILHSKLSQIGCHNCAFFYAVKHLSKKKVQIIELKHCFVNE